MGREPWEWKAEDLQRLIRNQIAEDPYIEYKAAGALTRTDKAKNEIAKDISAFAN